MPIETDCPGCGRTLRVPDRAAGGKARCPTCNTIYSVPDGGEVPARKTELGDRSVTWSLRTPEDRVYGPVSRQELDGWVAQGRVTADCQLKSSEDLTWQRAEVVYPVLTTVTACAAPDPRPATRSQANRPGTVTPRRFVEPHRGSVILVLGIVSWLVCPLFGVFAWLLGSADLRKMQAGRMDIEGRALTQAGQILGMVHILLSIAFLVLFLVFAILFSIVS